MTTPGPEDLVWAATSNPPLATAVGGKEVTLTLLHPSSPMGPFDFTIVGHDLVTGETNDAQVGGMIETPQADSSGNVTFTLEFTLVNLIIGHGYFFHVELYSSTYNLNAQSAQSNTVIAA
jgi:hypothetical protein